jgi:acyl carrier protein
MGQLTYESVLRDTVELIERHLPEPVVVTASSEFKVDLNFDSIGIMDMIAAIVDQVDVTIPLNELPRMQTVKQTAERLLVLAGNR